MVGRTISHYRVIDKLGEGGMGVIWKARDTDLNRFVALKVLPAGEPADPDHKRRLLQRLVHEAQAVSALNHPNIVTIYEIAREQDVDYIAMEYVSGQTLKALIARKGLNVEEALRHAVQIADAMAAAHAAGVVHGDLKPANIMVAESGVVKVLDFGLAMSAGENESGDDEITRTAPAVSTAAIRGTVAYMSPEQAEGKPTDPRSDIFSFGAVLYEMLTGRRAFAAKTPLSTLAAIISSEPKRLCDVRPEIPPELERIVARCLRKDPARRFQDVADLRVALVEVQEELGAEPAPLTRAPRPARVPRWIWAALVVIVAGLAAAWLRSRPESPGALRSVPVTSLPGRAMQPALSPDGNQVAFVWSGPKDDNYDIYVKLIGAANAVRLTSNPAPDMRPAWSPDGQFIAFTRNGPSAGAIFLIPPLGGAERRLCEVGGNLNSLTWTADGKSLVVGYRTSPQEPYSLRLVSVDTCAQERLTSPPAGLAGDSDPAFSPDGRTLAFARQHYATTGEIYLMPFAGNRPESAKARLLIAAGLSLSGLAWTHDGGSIVFAAYREGNQTLWRYPVKSGNGTPERVAIVGERANQPSISRAGKRLVYQHYVRDTNIWRMPGPSAHRRSVPTRLIASTLLDDSPQYSPDGKRIAFASNRTGSNEIWISDSEGASPVQLTFLGGPPVGTPRWSPEGAWIAFDSVTEGQRDIYVISSEGGIPRRLTTERSDDVRPSYSRDGKWIYFGSNRSGRWEIWKVPAQGGAAVQVTLQGGGHEAFESADGRYVYYEKIPTDSLWRIPSGGGVEEAAVPAPVLRGHWGLVNGGAVILNPISNPPALEFFRFTARRREHLADLPREFIPDRGFSTPALAVSPDGQWIAYVQLDRYDTDLVLIDNFQ